MNADPYEAQFPPTLPGPPPVVNYGGPKILDALKPIYTVELDAGAFRAVWELLEHEARLRFPTRAAMSSARAYVRAVQSFRSVYWTENEPPAPVKRLVRKTPRSNRSAG